MKNRMKFCLNFDKLSVEKTGGCSTFECCGERCYYQHAVMKETALTSQDSWSLALRRPKLQYNKELELEDDLQLEARRPSSLFVVLLRAASYVLLELLGLG